MQPMQEADMFVAFFTEAVKMEAESKKAGRPIFEDRAHIRIVIPGDKNNEVVKLAEQRHKDKYPKAWARFQSQETAATSGTPLEQWTQITRSQVKEAKYFNVHTVEEMALLSDGNAVKLGPGFQSLRTQAKAYLEAAESGAAASALALKNEQLTKDMAIMQEQLVALNAKFEDAPRGRAKRESAEA